MPSTIIAKPSARDTVTYQSDPTPTRVAWPAPRVEQATDRMRVEPLIFETAEESAFADVLASIPTAAVVVSVDGRVKYWSPAAVDLFGWSREEVLGKLPPFMLADRFAELNRLTARVRAGVRLSNTLAVRKHRSGRLLTLRMSAAPAADGGAVYWFELDPDETAPPVPTPEITRVIAADITRLETLGRLTVGLMREFDDLLAVVHSHAELLVEWLPSHVVGRQYADVIRTAARHAEALSKRLTDYAVPTARTSAVDVDVSAVVGSLEGLIRGFIGVGVHTVIQSARDLPTTWVERDTVEQAILNLVADARSAMPHGGSLGLRTAVVTIKPGRPGWPRDCPTGTFVCLTVADTGEVGFEPNGLTPPRSAGRPGLATVKELMALCGGYVEADEQLEFGNVCRVYFPTAAKPEAITDPLADVPFGRPDETVLLVDDDDSARDLAKAALESVGYSVIEASSGDDALRLAKVNQEPIDLLLTDIVMPGLGGRKLAERLRCSHPGLPVVYVSGYPQPSRTGEPGTVFLHKPFSPHELLAVVRQTMRQKANV